MSQAGCSLKSRSSAMRVESAIASFENSQRVSLESTNNSLLKLISGLEATKLLDCKQVTEQQVVSVDRFTESTSPKSLKNMRATVRYLDGPGSTCESCSCRCHTGKQYGQFRINPLRGILGSLSMIYAGWQLIGPRCSLFSCCRIRLKFLEVTYSSPLWPFQFSIIASLLLKDNEPTIGVTLRRTANVVDTNDPQGILFSTQSGNVYAMKTILSNRPAAVLDVSAHSNSSALHYTLAFRDLPGTKILLAAGADPFWEDSWGLPAIFWALRHTLDGACSNQERTELERHLPMSAFFDEYSFLHLHRVVLGVRPLDLLAELDKVEYRAEIDLPDGLGRTPLHWAAARSDASAVAALLSSGAAVDVHDKRNRTPLFEACLTNAQSCAKKLVAAGADVKARDDSGYSILHAAVQANATSSLISLLLSSGIDIDDTRNHYKCTPLARGTSCNSTLSCKYLLEQGADINRGDWENDTPIFEAVAYGAHSCLKLLLKWNANCLHEDSRKHTLLHAAAWVGNARTLEILATANLRGVDANAKNLKSMTARELFNRRSDLSTDLVEAFDALMKSVEARDEVPRNVVEPDNDDDEEFFDAAEKL